MIVALVVHIGIFFSGFFQVRFWFMVPRSVYTWFLASRICMVRIVFLVVYPFNSCKSDQRAPG